MSFQLPRRSPHGNSLNTAVLKVQVMNDVKPTLKQMRELDHRFTLHKLNVATSAAGFLTRDGTLPDGSRFRIVSNSGMHTLMLWPVHSTIELTDLLCGIFCIPADTSRQYGWVPPAAQGQNGTPATISTRADAGVSFSLQRSGGKTAGKGLQRFQPTLQPHVTNLAFFDAGWPNNTTLQQWEFREWISPDRKVVTFTYAGVIYANGVVVAETPPSGGLRTCIYEHDGEQYLFLVGFSGASTLRAHRRKLSGGAWELVASFDFSALDSEVGPPPPNLNMSPTALWWIKKVDFNASGTVASVWIQNPGTLRNNVIPNATRWVGITDIDMASGAITNTRAQGEVVRTIVGPDDPSGSGTLERRVIWSGVRQISFDYEGDEKVFTEMVFSGELHYSRVRALVRWVPESTPGAGNGRDGAISNSRQTTDTRRVVLRRGDFTYPIFENLTYTSLANSADQKDGASPFAWSAEEETTHQTDVVRCDVFFYGGMGGTILVVKRRQAYSGKTRASVSGTGFTSGPITIAHTNVTGDLHAELIAILPGGKQISCGSTVQPGFTASPTTFRQLFEYDRLSSLVPTDTNPTEQQVWASATRWPAVNEISGRSIETNMGGLQGHPEYDEQSGPNIDRSFEKWMNGRRVDDFVVFSVPRLSGHGPEPTKFKTYCSDPAILAKMNIDPELGVLKGIRLK